MTRTFSISTFALSVLLSLATTSAIAQVGNKPFSFKNGGPTSGMSIGGKQAILNRELFGSTPRNLIRGADGSLLSIQRGPNRLAIVSQPGGNVIPSYRGRSWKGDSVMFGEGVFNAFFAPRPSSGSYPAFVQSDSHDLVSTWTGQVVSNGPVGSRGASTVSDWTSYVYAMAAR